MSYKKGKTKEQYPLFFLVTFLLTTVFAFSVASCQRQNLEEAKLYIKLPEQVERWKVEGMPLEYEGDVLFLYINGGAEIYHEYGFDKVIVQDYTDQSGKSITLEMYEMSSPESAYGIYTFKRSQEGQEFELGNEGCLDEYYLNFWKGQILVTLTGFERDEETRQGLVRIARAVDALLPKIKGKPELISLLPEENLVKSSIKYFRGELALFNNYRFFDENVFSLEEGVRADYEAGYSIFLFRYSDVGKQSEVFTQAKKNFEKSPDYREYRTVNTNSMEVKRSEGDRIYMTYYDQYILVIVGDVPLSTIQGLVGKIKARLVTFYSFGLFRFLPRCPAARPCG